MSTNQPIAAVVSASGPLSGQKNRSSQNFQFFVLPSSGNVTGQVSQSPGSGSINATVFHEKGGSNDVIVGQIANGAVTIAANKLATGGANYYIASPQNAGSLNFEVTFSGSV